MSDLINSLLVDDTIELADLVYAKVGELVEHHDLEELAWLNAKLRVLLDMTSGDKIINVEVW